MRLDKYLVNCYIGSRKEVREMIKQKRIIVNGKVVSNNEYNILEKYDQVLLDDKPLMYKENYYFLLNLFFLLKITYQIVKQKSKSQFEVCFFCYVNRCRLPPTSDLNLPLKNKFESEEWLCVKNLKSNTLFKLETGRWK